MDDVIKVDLFRSSKHRKGEGYVNGERLKYVSMYLHLKPTIDIIVVFIFSMKLYPSYEIIQRVLRLYNEKRLKAA